MRQEYLDTLCIPIAMLLFLAVRPDIVLLVATLISVPYLLLTKRKAYLPQFGLAFLVALLWVFITRHSYGYNHDFWVVGGITLFPLFAWTLGVFWIRRISEQASDHLRLTKNQRLGAFITLYWPLMLSGEVVGYYLLGVQNPATAMYPGLPICHCLHNVWWIQAGYFLVGIVYWLLCEAANHFTKTKN
jgi:hypothetical protein